VANSRSASQELQCHLWKPKTCYYVHKIFLLVPALCPVDVLIFYVFKIHFNITLPFTLRFQKWSLLFRFSEWTSLCISRRTYACYIIRQPYPDFCEICKSWSTSLRSFVHLLLLLSQAQIFSLALCSQRPSIKFISFLCKSIGKILIFCILILRVLFDS
jgi:hypothetical protein